MDQEKEAKLLKEIADIENEQKHIKSLVATNDLQKLNNYLEGELTQKYFVEKALNNMFSFSRPVTVQESAGNAFDLLERLKKEKEAELTKEMLNLDK